MFGKWNITLFIKLFVLNSALSNQGDRYSAKYRLNLLGTQCACLRPGRSEAVSSPSDTGDWIIQSSEALTRVVRHLDLSAPTESFPGKAEF